MAKSKRQPRPRCIWTAKPRVWCVSYHGDAKQLHWRTGQCDARACFDLPVCRSHLQAWATSAPLEVAKRRDFSHASSIGLKVTVVFLDYLACGPVFEIALDPADALALADWYDLRGDKLVAMTIRLRALEITMRLDVRREAVLREITDQILQIAGHEATSPK